MTIHLWAFLMAIFATLSAGRRFLKVLGGVAMAATLVVLIAPFALTLPPMVLLGLKIAAVGAAVLMLLLTRSEDTRMIALLLTVAAGIGLLLQVWTPRLR